MKRAIVIGASSGIGRALAKILSENNYYVGITGRRAEKLRSLANENPGLFEVSCFSITSEIAQKNLDELVKKLGGLDLIVFSAGYGELNEKLDYDIEAAANKLNVAAFIKVANWAYHLFKKQGYGHFVGITSVAGIRGNGIAPAYNASKAYQINYLEGLRQKATKTDIPIHFTDIRPGFVDTAMAKGEKLFWVASKDKAAKQLFGLIQRKKQVGYITKRWRFIALLLKGLPKTILNRF